MEKQEKQDNQTRIEIHAFIIKNNIKAAALGLSQEHNTDDAKEYLIATNTILNAIYVVKKQYILEMKKTNKGPVKIINVLMNNIKIFSIIKIIMFFLKMIIRIKNNNKKLVIK